jgi:hypothetical protein
MGRREGGWPSGLERSPARGGGRAAGAVAEVANGGGGVQGVGLAFGCFGSSQIGRGARIRRSSLRTGLLHRHLLISVL